MKKMVFFCTGWMERYDGPGKITGGGRWVEENKWGGEIFNFKPFRNRYFGFVRPASDRSINIERLGATPSDEYIDEIESGRISIEQLLVKQKKLF